MLGLMPRSSLGTASIAASRRASICTVLSSDDRAEDLEDDDLVLAVENLRIQNLHLGLENEIFERLLQRVDPTLLEGLQESLESAAHTSAAHTRALAATLTIQPSEQSSRRGTDASNSSGRLTDRGRSPSVMRLATIREPKLSNKHKLAMASRAAEDLRIAAETAKVETNTVRNECTARTQMLHSALSEAGECSDELINKVASSRGTFTAESWLSHAATLLSKTDAAIARLRSQGSLSRSRLARLRKDLALKMEANQAVNSIDLEQLYIENADLVDKINNTKQEINALKKRSGKRHVQSSKLSRRHGQQLATLQQLNSKCSTLEHRTHKAKDRAVEVRQEVHLQATRIKHLRGIHQNFTAPSVSEYLKTKSEVSKLKQELKVWTRRRNIQHFSLTSESRILHRLSANMAEDPSSYHSRKGLAGILRMSGSPPPPSRE